MRAVEMLKAKSTLSDGRYVVSESVALDCIYMAREEALNSLRNHYAGLAMQALLEQGVDNNVVRIAREAVEAADALIRELNKD